MVKLAKKLNFEESMKKLEDIINKIESSDTDLDSTIKLYKEGIELSKYCMDKLNKSEEEVALLIKTMDGFELQPFEEPED